MSENLPIPLEAVSDAPPPVLDSFAPPPVNPLLRAHQFLTGRYRWAIMLGIILGAVGGIAAFTLIKPKYVSTGAIDVKPAVSRILYTNEQNSIMPMFDAYVDTQASLLESQRVVMMAMQSPEWLEAVRKSAPHSLIDFTDSMEVTHPKSSELISVAFTDKDPALAPIAVKALIEAYQRIYGESTADSNSQKMQILENLRKNLTDQLKGLNDRILAIGNEFGTDDLDPIYQYHLNEFNRIQTSIHEEELELAYAHAGATGAATQPSSAADSVSLTPQSIAAQDPVMQQLLGQQREEDELVGRLRSQFGPAHPIVLRAMAGLSATGESIAERLKTDEVAATQPGSITTLTNLGANSAISVKQAEQRLAELKTLRDRGQATLLDIGRKALQVRSLKADVATVQQNLDLAKSRIDQLNVESAVSGRISVLSTGDIPLRAKNQKIIIPAIGAASFGGLALGFAIVALFGAMDPRVRSVSEAHSFFDRSNRILGVLPALPDDLADPEQASMAAYCVHHIRTLLQVGAGSAAHATFAVTSAAPGEGKTSLIHSLGLSYAATGMKTLLIDFDVVGAGLTARVNAIVRRKIGDILIRAGLLTNEQLADALAFAQQSGKRLGETLVERGLLQQHDLDQALAAQKESSLGLLEVLDGERLQNCIIDAGAPNLSILPMGNVGARHGGQVSIHAAQRILQSAREAFDVVLLDTGPILGSLEACIVTAVVDEVIVVVSRGQERPLIDRTFSRLSDVGAHVSGIVFNRAREEDIQHSGYSSSYSGQSIKSPVLSAINTNGNTRRLGPVARAVATVEDSALSSHASGDSR